VGRHRKTAAQSVAQLPSLLTPREWKQVVRIFGLPPQQARVVEQILLGKRDKQIAVELGLSTWTVRSHLTRTFVRLGVRDRSELLLRIFRVVRERE
jgi:DNA-binding NarL/FixJ family response regulator